MEPTRRPARGTAFGFLVLALSLCGTDLSARSLRTPAPQGLEVAGKQGFGIPKSKGGILGKGKKKGGLILPGGKRRTTGKKRDGILEGGGQGAKALAMARSGGIDAFLQALVETRAPTVEECVARYSLLSEKDRRDLEVKAYRLPPKGVARLARLWAALPEPRGLPVLHALLRGRDLGSSTSTVVRALLDLSGPRARAAAFSLLESDRKRVRGAAELHLAESPRGEDLERLTALCRHKSKGTRLAALRLLGRWLREDPDLDLRPLAALLKHGDPAMRALAVRILASIGVRAVPALKPWVAKGLRTEASRLAALLLSESELRSGQALLPDEVLAAGLELRRAGRPFDRQLAAILAGTRLFLDPEVSLHGRDGGAQDPRRVCEDLVRAVEVRSFFTEMPLCHRMIVLRLRLLSGEDFGIDHLRWSAWWKETKHGFLPFRKDAPDEGPALDRSFLVYRESGKPRFVLIGPETEESAVPGAPIRFRLTRSAMGKLRRDLELRGFLNLAARLEETADLPETAKMDFVWASGRCRDGFTGKDSLRLRSLLGVCEEVLEREAWQDFAPRNLSASARLQWWRRNEGDLGGRLEDPRRRSRVLDLCIDAFGSLEGAARRRALGLLLEESRDPARLLDTGRAKRLLEAATKTSIRGEDLASLMEVLAQTAEPGIFAFLLDLLDANPELGIRDRLARLLALSDERGIEIALRHSSAAIRAAAAAEAGRLRGPRIRELLVESLKDEDPEVRARAAESCGRLGDPAVLEPLSARLGDRDDRVRHATMVALGRLGGKGVYETLWKASSERKAGDQLFAVRGLSLLDDSRVGEGLLRIAIAHYPKPVGLQALQGLRGRGGPDLRRALRKSLDGVRAGPLQRELLMLLGEMQDPYVFPRILSFLASGTATLRACRILADISGVDHCDAKNRVERYQAWWNEHAKDGPARWFLDALEAEGFRTDLTPAVLAPGAGLRVVRELARVLEKARSKSLRRMALRWLRETLWTDLGGLSPEATLGERQALAERYLEFARKTFGPKIK